MMCHDLASVVGLAVGIVNVGGRAVFNIEEHERAVSIDHLLQQSHAEGMLSQIRLQIGAQLLVVPGDNEVGGVHGEPSSYLRGLDGLGGFINDKNSAGEYSPTLIEAEKERICALREGAAEDQRRIFDDITHIIELFVIVLTSSFVGDMAMLF